MTWQHNQNLNLASSFPQPLNQPHPPPAQIHHSARLPQYNDAFSPEPAPPKIMKTTMVPPDNPQGRQLEPATATGQPAPLPVHPKKAWLTPPEEWQPGDGLLDKTPLYSFNLPIAVATTPHNTHRDMSGMDIRDVRLVQVIQVGISNWLLRPFAHGRFVTWEGFRTRTEALLWSTCSLEKDLAGSVGLNIDDFNQRIKVHEHLSNLVLEFLHQHHASIKTQSPEDVTLQKYTTLNANMCFFHVIRTGNGRSSMPKIMLMTVFNPLLGLEHGGASQLLNLTRVSTQMLDAILRSSDASAFSTEDLTRLQAGVCQQLSDRARQASQPHQPARTSRSADPLESTGALIPICPQANPAALTSRRSPSSS